MDESELPVGPLVEEREIPLPAHRKIAGQSVALLPLDAERDATGLYHISHGRQADELIWTYMGYGPFEDVDAMQEWLAEIERSTDPLFFTVINKFFGTAVGMISLQRIKPQHRTLEIAHVWYGQTYQRTKTNTEAVYLLLSLAFDELGYRRVEWKCDALNARSRAAALRLGFSHEGVFRQHMIVKGRSRDTAWFAMLDHEWPQVKANIEQWLYTDDSVSLSELNGRR